MTILGKGRWDDPRQAGETVDFRQGFTVAKGSPKVGEVTLNGATPVVVTNANITAYSIVLFGLNTANGTVGAIPTVKTITEGTSFTVAGTALDNSVYNYIIVNLD